MSTAQKAFAWIGFLLQGAIIIGSLAFSYSMAPQNVPPLVTCDSSSASRCSPEQIDAMLSAANKVQTAQATLIQTMNDAMRNIGYGLLACVILQLVATWGILIGRKSAGSSQTQ